ncbi:MAG TPA: hypothetical protein VMK65_10355 [Longimicrobiales bacterium]|nr:hypothetical protein [Longimicrobiales bacterium]
MKSPGKGTSGTRSKRGPKTVTVDITFEDGKPGVQPDQVHLKPGDTVRFRRMKNDWEVDVELNGKQSPFLFGQKRFRPGKGRGQVRKQAPADCFPFCVTVAGVSMDPDIVIEPPDDGG